MQKLKHMHDAADLQKLFAYNPQTGILTRLTTGKPCGTLLSTGHMTVWVNGRGIGIHRIAWALHHGEYPALEVDHINGNGADNRICNLRLATSSQNNQNRRLSSRNRSGVKGVFQVRVNRNERRRYWRVSIGYGRGKYYITHFECFGAAVKHSREMRLKLHKEFANMGGG